MKKKYLLYFFFLLQLIHLSNCLADQNIVIKSSDVHGKNYPTVGAVRYMGELLSSWTNKRITIQIYPEGKLGSEKDTLEQTRQGYIEMTRVSLGPVGKYAKGLNVFNLPFIFRNIEHMHKVVDGEIGDTLLLELEQAGLIGLCYMDSGARSFYNSKKPIRSPDDMKGLKFRVMNNPIFIEMVQAFGAQAVSIPFSETYQAIKSGAVDGAENNSPTIFTQKHYEVTRYYSLTQHLIVPEVLVFSKIVWDSLSTQDQELIAKAATACSIRERELWQKKEQVDLAELNKHGFIILEEIDKKPFIAATNKIREKYGSEFSEVIKKIEGTD
jgi:tripartite ATP-independent transporter DctP family solute receptor